MHLSEQFQPQSVQITLDCAEDILIKARDELLEKAVNDPHRCFGYFPALRHKPSIDSHLPHCVVLSNIIPQLVVGSKQLQFNFVRMSLIKQVGDSPYHLDSDAATAITGDVSTVGGRLIWRLLLNLSDTYPRTLSYLDMDPFSVQLEAKGGYIHCPNSVVQKEIVRFIRIKPRNGTTVFGVLFCASRVLHTGQDDEHGHFVAGYGCEGYIL